MTLSSKFVKPYARVLGRIPYKIPGVLTEKLECGQYPTDAEISYKEGIEKRYLKAGEGSSSYGLHVGELEFDRRLYA